MVDTPWTALFNNTFYLVAVVMVGMFVAYVLELAERKDYFLSLELHEERENTEQINAELETRVKERTTELEIANRELAQEVMESNKAKKDKAFLEHQLRQSHKMEAIGTLAGGIAHDFNNILSSVMGYAELAMTEAPEDSTTMVSLNEILTAGTRAKDLVNQILTFSTPTEQEMKPIEISSIIEEVLKLIRASLPSTIQIRQHVETKSIIMADSTQIHQVLMNLCTNAGHAMKEVGGILEIHLTDLTVDEEFANRYHDLNPGPHILLRIRDNGPGMGPEVMDRIFDPFFTTKAKGEGSGMGLSVVHGIIRGHKGVITVSSALGVGSYFDIYFPCIEHQKREEKNNISEPILGGSERILFVDDDQTIVKMSSQMLARMGYSVESRTSGLEALRLFETDGNRFDLLITDLNMPGMRGDELASAIHALRQDLPIILCTGFNPNITEAQAKTCGIRTIVDKPLLTRDISKTIRSVLDN